MRFLLDTSIYSQPLRRRPNARALERWDSVGDDQCCISVVCRAEVGWGLCKQPDENRDLRYRRLLRDRLPVLSSDEDCWRRFSEMKARQEAIGEIVADLDLLIAATARRHDLVLATLNRSDFNRIEGLLWEDWSA